MSGSGSDCGRPEKCGASEGEYQRAPVRPRSDRIEWEQFPSGPVDMTPDSLISQIGDNPFRRGPAS